MGLLVEVAWGRDRATYADNGNLFNGIDETGFLVRGVFRPVEGLDQSVMWRRLLCGMV